MDSEPKDDELIEGIGRGEESALVELMRRHKEAVFRFSYRYLNNEADSAEATEETFFKVYQNADRFKPKAAPKTWIFTIARNVARDRLRRNQRHRKNLALDAQLEGEDSALPLTEKTDSGERSPSEHLQSNDDLKRIREEVSSLPEKLRFPFVFCTLEGNSYDECAEILRTSRKTVETRIYRARQALKRQLSRFHEKS